MRLEDELADFFQRRGWTWHLKGDRDVVPSAYEIEEALDEAARLLYNEEVGSQLEVGRLIIKRLHHGFDVYVYVGEYD